MSLTEVLSNVLKTKKTHNNETMAAKKAYLCKIYYNY